jgi:hypothetical protein
MHFIDDMNNVELVANFIIGGLLIITGVLVYCDWIMRHEKVATGKTDGAEPIESKHSISKMRKMR